MIVLKQVEFSSEDLPATGGKKIFNKVKENAKFRAKRAKFRYKDSLDYYNNEEAVEEDRRKLKSIAEESRKRSGSNDSRQTIYHPNGSPETIKDPEKYAFRKEETRRAENRNQRKAERALDKFDRDRKHPKLAAIKAATKSLGERTYSDDNKAAQEAGMIAGSLGVGALGGLGVHKLAKNSSKYVDKAHKHLTTSVINKGHKIADKSGKAGMEWLGEVKKYRDPKLAKLNNANGKIKSVTDKVSKFAKTKGGKWAIIGGTTAALGGAAYLGAKKEDKKK